MIILLDDFLVKSKALRPIKEKNLMAHNVLPNGQIIGEHVTPQISMIYVMGKLPRLLPGVGGTN
jgi:hypothetical protein